ncbi:MAG: tRNA pseudouridine(13) synthase TruD [Candidatus Aenigmatarchaeota archaeon]|nr:MAG: tRNA pseudouridine(13) synthase TruD [Candidatus Aenigmarchaeota archaeon]
MEKNLDFVKKNGFVNYFGEQRFGLRKNTHLVGKAIVRNRLKEAVWIYLTKEGDKKEEFAKFRENLAKTQDFKLALKECPRSLRNELALLNHLVKKPNDYAGALRKIPKKFRRMFVHAYQSYLWNGIAKFSEELRIPIIGFQTDLTKYKTRKEIEKILKRENLETRDFRIKSMPELSSEGDERERVAKVKGMKWRFEKDEKNEDRLKCVFEFEIPRGSYATTLLRGVLE